MGNIYMTQISLVSPTNSQSFLFYSVIIFPPFPDLISKIVNDTGYRNQSSFKTTADTFKLKHVIQGTLYMLILFNTSIRKQATQYFLSVWKFQFLVSHMKRNSFKKTAFRIWEHSKFRSTLYLYFCWNCHFLGFSDILTCSKSISNDLFNS